MMAEQCCGTTPPWENSNIIRRAVETINQVAIFDLIEAFVPTRLEWGLKPLLQTT